MAAPRRGRTRFLPHLRIRLAKDICCVAKKRVFTRKASLPCLPGDVSPDRHAAGEGVGGRVIKSTRRCCSSIGELSDHPCNLCLHARRLSLPRFSVTVAISFQFSKFGRGRTPRTNTFPFSFARGAPRHRSWLRHAGDGPASSLTSVSD